jgi:GT2 family glycosyltransferase
MKHWLHDELRAVDAISGCFWCVRREALDQVGLLDEDFFFYGEDLDWCKRFHDSGWDVIFYPEAKVIHFGGGSSSNAPVRFYIELQKADVHYWQKYHRKTGAFIYKVIILFRHLIRLPFRFIRYLFHPSNRKINLLKLNQCLSSIQWVLHLKKQF